MVSYNVTVVFTNVSLDETIQILAKKSFTGNWFNSPHNLNISESDLIQLLTIATKDQLFQFNGALYQQVDGVAIGTPLGPLMANTFMCSMEEKLANENKLSDFYRRYVDDTFAPVPDLPAADDFLASLNDAHQAIQFTVQTAVNNKLAFVGMVIIKTDNRLNTCHYRKKTNKGLLLHYQSHVDNGYKRSLLRTMIDLANRLSSSPALFSQERKELKSIFLKLKYPEKLIDFCAEPRVDRAS